MTALVHILGLLLQWKLEEAEGGGEALISLCLGGGLVEVRDGLGLLNEMRELHNIEACS